MNTPTLFAAAEEFRISQNGLITFLVTEGFPIEKLKNDVDLTEEMYAAAEGRFAEDLAARRIKQCIATKNTDLDIGKCSLTDKDFTEGSELDRLLRQCTHLKKLILSNSWWEPIAQKCYKSINNKSRNYFSVLPGAVTGCKELTTFICSGYDATDFSFWWQIQDISVLAELTQLEYLDLYRNQIKDASSLSNLTNLKCLYLSGNLIENGAFLEPLSTLQSLDLSYNQVSAVSLKGLTHLQHLYLSNNQIRDTSFLVDPTRKETILQSLDLSNNQIAEVASLISLTSLRTLNLSNNQIKDVYWLSNLTGLQSLDLSGNEITNVSFLANLTRNNHSLQSVDLSNNQIAELEKLDFLHNTPSLIIQVTGNPFVKKHQLDLKIQENHLPFILALLKRLGSKPFTFPLKVLMLGNHGAGKSTVVDYLTQKENTGSTHILRIENYYLKSKSDAMVPDVVFYDFGGQDFYHGLYQTFLSTGTLQLIVFKNENDKNEPGSDTDGNAIFYYNQQYWLGQKVYREGIEKPDPYIMIQTYADQPGVKKNVLPDYSLYKGHRQSFFLSFSPTEKKEDVAFYQSGRSYFKAFFDKEVKALLASETHTQKYGQWFLDFMQFILKKDEKKHEPTTLEDLLAHFQPEEQDMDKRKILLRTELTQLHRHGLVLYYDKKELQDFVWLNPQALVQHVQATILSKKIITDNHPGIVAVRDLQEMADEKTLEMLIQQKVIFLHQPDKTKSEWDEYIIPNYLPIANEKDINYQLLTFGIGKPNFIIKFNDFIPFGFINQMICFYGQQLNAKKFWRNQLLFTLHGEARVLIQLDFVQLKIEVHFQLLNSSPAGERKITEYLFFTLLALYWDIEKEGITIPKYEAFTSIKEVSGNESELDNRKVSANNWYKEEKYIPPDAYLSVDDERYICYKDLVKLPENQYRILSYSLNEGRVNREDVKEIPASLFAAFTVRKLSTMKNVFISYSHNEIQYRQELQTYLVNLERDGLIQIWQDGLIQTGDEWDKKIRENLENADICIMLLSQSFIVSNYVHEVELKTIMEKRKKDTNCRIIPVLIKDCDWKNWKAYPQDVLDTMSKEDNTGYKLASFQFLPLDDADQRLKPLNKWPYPEEAWMKVATAIREFCNEP